MAKRSPFFRPDIALKRICQKRNLDYKKYQATKLRKHFATATSNIDETTQKLVSEFMGHSYNIHENIYQQRQVQTDISVMGRLLYDASGLNRTNNPVTTELIPQNASNRPSYGSQVGIGQVMADSDDDNNQTIELTFQNASNNTSNEVMADFAHLNRSVNRETKKFATEKCCDQALNDIHLDQVVNDTSSENSISFQTNRKTALKGTTKRKSEFGLKINTYKQIRYQEITSSRTWRTPHKALCQKVFQSYIQTESVPRLSVVQKELLEKNVSINRTPLQIQWWIRSEIASRQKTKGSFFLTICYFCYVNGALNYRKFKFFKGMDDTSKNETTESFYQVL